MKQNQLQNQRDHSTFQPSDSVQPHGSDMPEDDVLEDDVPSDEAPSDEVPEDDMPEKNAAKESLTSDVVLQRSVLPEETLQKSILQENTSQENVFVGIWESFPSGEKEKTKENGGEKPPIQWRQEWAVKASDGWNTSAPLTTLTSDAEFQKITEHYRKASQRVKEFPHAPGVYLMKNEADCVIYIGKAKDLRNRASSYFHRQAADDMRTAALVREIDHIDCLEAESEVDAILMEARLIKDIQPKYNRELKDDKTFPYLQIRTREPYPRVEVTRTPLEHGGRLFGPFPSASLLKGAVNVLQKIFKFRTCSMTIREGDERLQYFRPCILASIGQCSAPCNYRIPKELYRRNVRRLQEFLNGERKKLLFDLREEMKEEAEKRHYERAAELRDQIFALESLKERGKIDENVQPEAFQIDPRRGVLGLQKIFKLETPPRVIEGIDIAHLSGKDTVASLVQFLDGLPFKSGYRRYKIRSVHGVDDFASIAEVVARRFAVVDAELPPPDILLIDGGKGQLHAACSVLARTKSQPGMIISLAKRDEEIYVPGQDEPLRLSRHSFALRLLQYVRDESHRFAQHYHHILRKKSTFGDNLDDKDFPQR